MVEGHQCHRVAAAHRRLLLGKAFQARSPNGRFKEGAAAINAKPLQRIEVHGKNLFYFFSPLSSRPGGNDISRPTSTRGNVAGTERAEGGRSGKGGGQGSVEGGSSDGTVVMHVHFGMSGAFRTMSLPGPQPTETTRLELLNKEMGLVAHLSAMTVAHGSLALYAAKAAQLGPDPLREDADKELLWSKLACSRKPIGQVLMDQSMVAGVGNIYRAEILFKSGVHPETPATSIGRSTFDRIWYHCVDLLQRGFVSGSIVTVDPEEAIKLGRPWTRRYIYNQKTCGRCKGPVRTWDMAARTVYCCENCQPLQSQQGPRDGGSREVGDDIGAGAGGSDGGGSGSGGSGAEGCVELSAARLAALAAARPARVFPSHCAPDDPEDAGMAPGKLTVKELRSRLLALNLDTRGTKPLLVARLEAALRWQQPQPQEEEQQHDPRAAQLNEKQELPPPPPPPTTTTKAMEPDEEEGEDEEKEGYAEEDEDEKSLSGDALVGQPPIDHDPLLNSPAEGHRMLLRGNEQEPSHHALLAGPGTPGAAAGPGGDSGGGDGGEGGHEGSERDRTDSATSLDQAERQLCQRLSADTTEATAAPSLDPSELPRLTVAQLKTRLRQLGRALSGTKPLLLQRLREALNHMTEGQNPAEAAVASLKTAQAGGRTDMEVEAPAAAKAPVASVDAAAAKGRRGSSSGRTSRGRTTGVSNNKKGSHPVGDTQPQTGPPGTPDTQPTRAPITPPEDQPDGAVQNPTATETVPVATTEAVAAAGDGGGEHSDGGGGSAGLGGKYDIQPGAQRLQALMVSAKDAALGKLLAGENRAVEHVALEDDEVVDLFAGGRQQQHRGGAGGGRGRKRGRATVAAVGGNGDVEEGEEGPRGDGGVGAVVEGDDGVYGEETKAAPEKGGRRKRSRIVGGRR